MKKDYNSNSTITRFRCLLYSLNWIIQGMATYRRHLWSSAEGNVGGRTGSTSDKTEIAALLEQIEQYRDNLISKNEEILQLKWQLEMQENHRTSTITQPWSENAHLEMDLGAVGWPLSAASSLTPLPRKNSGRKENKKSSWLKIKMGRALTTYHHGQNRRGLGKIIYLYLKAE